MLKPRIISAAEAIAEGTRSSMLDDRNVVILGEGVTDPKGIFGTTFGLLEEFGSTRVYETPVAESAVTGISIGLSIAGKRPVLVHQRVEFALLAMEQICNNAAKTCYVSNGQHSVPLVMRMIVGRGWGQGPAHSQALETLFAHIPGLKVVMPSTAYDAKGTLIAAIRDPNPVLIIEHRWYHYVTGHVPMESYETQLSGFHILRNGKDISLAATSYGVYEALLAADVLSEIGIEAEVVDLRVLRPFEPDVLWQSVRKTGHLITIDTGWSKFGVGAEVVSSVVENCFSRLKKAPVRLGLRETPTPSSKELAKEFYPGAELVIHHVAEQLGLSAPCIERLSAILSHKKPNVEIDVPNPQFKGPF